MSFIPILRYINDIFSVDGYVACYEKSDPSVMKVFSPFGKETIDEYEEAEATQSGADRGEAA
jgi:hypothetical protein